MPKNILVAGIIIAGALIYVTEKPIPSPSSRPSANSESVLEEKVLSSKGVILPVRWGNLGKQLVAADAIDSEKFQALYVTRGKFTAEYRDLLLNDNNSQLKITRDNAGYLLNLFWALGLASKNAILDYGEMSDKMYGGADRFASTGGWSLAKGNPMNHFSRHQFFSLTANQQMLVDRVSRGIYRPCCDNSTHFPDCNHGLAMLGFLELMAAQGVSEQEMYKAALTVNSYWFLDNYKIIAKYLESQGQTLETADPKEILGANYSGGSGYRQILARMNPVKNGAGSSCGV